MASPRILAFSASTRRESFNRKLLAVTIDAVTVAGGAVTLVDLNDFPMPLYNGDLEDRDGLPSAAAKLIALIVDHPALLIASPEYNSMITPLLKNTIDWCTRGDNDPFPGKVAAVVSASPGAFGGLRSQLMAQQLLLKLGCHIVPTLCTLPKAAEAFDEKGKLKDQRSQKSVEALAASLVKLTSRFAV